MDKLEEEEKSLSLEEYQKIFGSKKMQKLWCEFIAHAETSLHQIENESTEKQQTCFHNLRAYGLVFDMFDFANLCTEMENQVIKFGKISKKEADIARMILKNSIAEIEQKLAGGK